MDAPEKCKCSFLLIQRMHTYDIQATQGDGLLTCVSASCGQLSRAPCWLAVFFSDVCSEFVLLAIAFLTASIRTFIVVTSMGLHM
jgi:hypothetical protein